MPAPEVTPKEQSRREFMRRFGLTAAGITLGSYAAPALASFRPPAALVGSNEVTFFEEDGKRTTACDGPACAFNAGSYYSINSTSFLGQVLLQVVPTAPTTGWILTLDKTTVAIKPGEQVFVHLTMDCYSHPQIGATPEQLKVRVTATAVPADGSPPFNINTHMARAECVISALEVVAPPGPIKPDSEGNALTTVMVNGAWIDSAAFGNVLLNTALVPEGWTVALEQAELPFAGTGSFPVRVRINVPPKNKPKKGEFRVIASLNHPSFAAPMTSIAVIKVHGK
ncbi:MAG: hypothetical protein ACT4PU_00460 [Planctomycetota bacterium]